MQNPLTATSVQVIGQELAVAWNDGSEAYFPLEFLRRQCPCAVCGGEPDVLGRVERPQVDYGPGSFQMTSYAAIGGYAIQPRWADGHASGIYSFRYLRSLQDLLPG